MTAAITPLTPQQVFDNALFGVRAQGAFSKRPSTGVCAYRTPLPTGETLKCGIGHSIPDELYDTSMDNADDTSIAALMIEAESDGGLRVLEDLFGNCHTGLLSDLQTAHDIALHMRDFEQQMCEVARTHDLIYTPPSAP